MAKLLAPDDGMAGVNLDGVDYTRGKDGTYDVPSHDAAKLMRGLDFTRATLRINGRGYTCQRCGFVALFRDRCGRCGGTELVAEDA